MRDSETADLSASIQALFRAVETQRRRLAESNGTSITELRALARIAETPRVSLTVLATGLHLSPSSVSTLMETLVSKGLVWDC